MVGPQAEKTRPEPQSPSVRKDRFGREEEWWREKMKEWQDKQKSAQTNYEKTHQAWKAKEKELEDSKFKPNSLKRRLGAEIKELEEKAKTWEKEVKEATNMIQKVLPSQAEEDRADPNWLKPKEKVETPPGPGTSPDAAIK
jgi:chromosome segregation ATPase